MEKDKKSQYPTCPSYLPDDGERVPSEVVRNLSPFHKGIARMLAEGKRGKEVCREMGISASRLSVLKGSPLMKKAIYYYEGVVERGFEKARKKLDEGAVLAAKVVMAAIEDNSGLTAKEKAQLGLAILDRLGVKGMERKSTKPGGGKVLFEQRLRVIKDESLDRSDMPSEFEQMAEALT